MVLISMYKTFAIYLVDAIILIDVHADLFA